MSQRAARPRRPHGPPRLDAAHGRRVLFRARPDRPAPVTRAFRRAAAAATPARPADPQPEHLELAGRLRVGEPRAGRARRRLGGPARGGAVAGPRRARRRVRRRFPPAAVHRCRLGRAVSSRTPRSSPAPGRGWPTVATSGCSRPVPPRCRCRTRRWTSCTPAPPDFFGRGLRAGSRRGGSASCGRARAIAVVDLDAHRAARTAAWMRADLPRYDPAAVRGVLRRTRGSRCAGSRRSWRFPDRATPRRGAAHRVQPRRRRARDRAPRSGSRSRWATGCTCAGRPRHVDLPPVDQRGIPAAGAETRPAAHHAPRAGTVGGPVGGDGTVRAQAS